MGEVSNSVAVRRSASELVRARPECDAYGEFCLCAGSANSKGADEETGGSLSKTCRHREPTLTVDMINAGLSAFDDWDKANEEPVLLVTEIFYRMINAGHHVT